MRYPGWKAVSARRSATVAFVQRRMLHQARYGCYPPASGIEEGSEEFTVLNPATGESLCKVTCASEKVVGAAIDKAQSVYASGIWSKSSAIHRSKVLSNLARALEVRIPEFAKIETLQTGRTIREMNAQLGRLPEWLDYFAALLRTNQAFVAPTQGKLLNYVQRVPLGVVAQITPFNHPLLIAVKKIAPALAAGNSVVVKPSELAPITVLEFAKLAESVGVPHGVLTVLPGYGPTTGKAIVTNPHVRKVDITAGTQTGRTLGSLVGANLAAFTAELGGKAPIVVFNDADLASAVNGAAFAAFVASGQTCVSGTRIIVQNEIYDNFMDSFVRKTESIRRRMGDPMNPKSTMGTVISLHHLERIEGMIKRRRSQGTIVTGGKSMDGISELDGFDFSRGSFFPPTIVADITSEDELWKEEVFGPVIVVRRFSSEAEGVALANDCKYGLGAGIWTSDLSRAHRVAADIETGLCWVNTHHRNDPSSPWGGMKESGIGRENGLEAFEAYSQSKSTIVNIATAEETRQTDDWFSDETDETAGRRYG
ncbi:NAD/NADP-dependent betaine aldehyde dehydrogenase [Hypsizygus marmoreus]|uniref:NAD/NADP-dependent betaine aldehyde dehydrogenase n=1 Tax=Hypsizygus marmoreus TaxID=39966 RepID=A0A369JF18_HYPMA|nr:NAD/NADP-dependent betaine aldehyde dehydrogenase [Hypsizygus marmoreus]